MSSVLLLFLCVGGSHEALWRVAQRGEYLGVDPFQPVVRSYNTTLHSVVPACEANGVSGVVGLVRPLD